MRRFRFGSRYRLGFSRWARLASQGDYLVMCCCIAFKIWRVGKNFGLSEWYFLETERRK